MKTALVLLFNNVEEIEAVAPVDILRRAGIEVITASLEEDIKVIGRSGITVECDELFEDAFERDFDVVVLPGGAGVMNWINYPPLKQLLVRQIAKGGFAAAICAAPAVFKAAGILEGAKCACHPSVADRLAENRVNGRVVCDKNIITSRGAGTAIEFGLAIAEMLAGKSTSNDVAKSICFID